MDSPEDVICLFVSTSSFPPAFDHPSIIAEDFKVFSRCADCDESADKKLEANSFCPSNVAASSLLAWDKAPRMPPSCNDDADPDA